MLCIITSITGEAIQVWVLYCQFAVDKMEMFDEGVKFVRDIFDHAVIACGQHVTKVIRVGIALVLLLLLQYAGWHYLGCLS